MLSDNLNRCKGTGNKSVSGLERWSIVDLGGFCAANATRGAKANKVEPYLANYGARVRHQAEEWQKVSLKVQ